MTNDFTGFSLANATINLLNVARRHVQTQWHQEQRRIVRLHH